MPVSNRCDPLRPRNAAFGECLDPNGSPYLRGAARPLRNATDPGRRAVRRWTWFWFYAAGKIETTIDGWRAREARPARLCLRARRASGFARFARAELRWRLGAVQRQPVPLEIKSRGVLVAAQVYQPKLLISEFHGL